MTPDRILRTLILLSHGALMLGLGIRFAWAGLVMALPLALPLPGMWQQSLRAHGACSLLVVLYLGGLLFLFLAEPAARWVNGTLATVAAVEFSALMLFVKGRKRAAAQS